MARVSLARTADIIKLRAEREVPPLGSENGRCVRQAIFTHPVCKQHHHSRFCPNLNEFLLPLASSVSIASSVDPRQRPPDRPSVSPEIAAAFPALAKTQPHAASIATQVHP